MSLRKNFLKKSLEEKQRNTITKRLLKKDIKENCFHVIKLANESVLLGYSILLK